jgi:hypothetical protein
LHQTYPTVFDLSNSNKDRQLKKSVEPRGTVLVSATNGVRRLPGGARRLDQSRHRKMAPRDKKMLAPKIKKNWERKKVSEKNGRRSEEKKCRALYFGRIFALW